MPRSPMDHLVMSFRPDNALDIIMGNTTILLVVNPSEAVQKYTGRMVLHTTPYPDDDDSCSEYVTSLGLTPEALPGSALVALLTVGKVFEYNQMTFAMDDKRHGFGVDLAGWQNEVGATGFSVWGIPIDRVECLVEPVVDVIGDYIDNDIFVANEDPLLMQAVKLALKRETQKIDWTDFKKLIG